MKPDKKTYLLQAYLGTPIGYYVGQLLLWVMGETNLPRFTLWQLLNIVWYGTLGLLLVRIFYRPNTPMWKMILAGALTLGVLRFAVMLVTDIIQEPHRNSSSLMISNLRQGFAGFIAGALIVLVYHKLPELLKRYTADATA